ncbi:hypothetical protein IWZ01DRAFT_507281 [Phyllosticta capitalensis]
MSFVYLGRGLVLAFLGTLGSSSVGFCAGVGWSWLVHRDAFRSRRTSAACCSATSNVFGFRRNYFSPVTRELLTPGLIFSEVLVTFIVSRRRLY